MTMFDNDFVEYEDEPTEDELLDPEFEEWVESVKNESIDPDEFPDWLSTSAWAPEEDE